MILQANTPIQRHMIYNRKNIQEMSTVTKDKKAKLWVGKEPKSTAFSKRDLHRVKIRIKRVRDSLRAGSHLEPACKL